MNINFKERIKADIEKNRKRVKSLGPGIITGGAGDDPAGIVTYILVGAYTGFSQLWLLFLSTPMMIAVQDIVARIAIVSGKSMPELTNTFYSKRLTYLMITVLAVANILTIGADLNSIAAILHIFTGIKTVYLLIPITAFISYLITFGKYRTVKHVLIFFTLVLAVYIIAAIIAKPPLLELLKNTFIPHIRFENVWMTAALGLLGTTISPYMLFWQAAEEKEEKKSVVQADEADFDTTVGMIYSNLLAYCMIIVGAVFLWGQTGVDSLEKIAATLHPVAGDYAFALFSIGVIASGLLAIPVLAGSTAYAVADAFGWREGLDNKVSDAKGFYIVFVGALLVGDFIDLSSAINAVDALYYSQVLDGFLIPILIAIILALGSNKEIVGPYVITPFQKIFALFALLLTLTLSLSTVWSWL